LIKRKQREGAAADAVAKRAAKDDDHPVLRKRIDDRKAEALSPRVKGAIAGTVAAPSVNDKAILNPSDQAEDHSSFLGTLGAADPDFARGLLGQMLNTHSQGVDKLDGASLAFMLSVIKGIKPKDQLESMLAAQMAAIHIATMKFAGKLSRVTTILEQDSIERALNKLARTYTTQMEVLKRYRTGGEQNVTVQHVSVSDGGQAIVGNVTQAANDTMPKKLENATRALTDAHQSEMEIIGDAKRATAALSRRQNNGGQSST
jgi:hypothetical protein